MKIRVLFFFGFILIITGFLQAQNNTDAVVKADSSKSQFIYMEESTSVNFNMGSNGIPRSYNSTYSSFRVGETGEFKGLGVMGANIEPYLKKDPQAYKEFRKFKTKETLRFTLWGVAVLSGMIGAVTVNKGTGEYTWDPMKNKMVEKKEIRPLGAVLIGVSLTSFLAGIIVGNNSKSHISRAVNIYNENLSNGIGARWHLNIRPRINTHHPGVSVCLNW